MAAKANFLDDVLEFLLKFLVRFIAQTEPGFKIFLILITMVILWFVARKLRKLLRSKQM
jgi:hypothetical protein